MKNLFYVTAIVFCGCQQQAQQKVKAINYNGYDVANRGVQILAIDSCEYVWCKNGYGAGLTHKGNCKFCVERSKR